MRTGIVIICLMVIACALSFFLTYARANERDPRCQQLEQLSDQYRGVALTASQKIFKVKATAWYSFNCRGGRRSAENR